MAAYQKSNMRCTLVGASAMRFAESICFDKFLRCAHNLMRISLRHIRRVIVLLSRCAFYNLLLNSVS